MTLQVREDRWTGGTPQVELSGPALAEPQTVACKPWGNAPGQYHADLGRLAEGRYRVRVVGAAKDETSAEAAFDVRGNLKERLDVAARPANMTWIAQASGGAELERGRTAGRGETCLTNTSSAAGPSGSSARPPGIAGGCWSGPSPSGARPGA